MAITPSTSDQYTDYAAEPVEQVSASDWSATVASAVGTLTFTAAGTGTAQMIRLPAGRKLIFPDLCRIICPIGTATSDLHVGHTAYTEPDGTAVAADDNAFADNLDVGGAAIDAAFSLPAGAYFEMDSTGAVDIEVMFDTANSPAAGTMTILVVYAINK